MDDHKPTRFRILWGSLFAQLGLGVVIAFMGIEFLNKAMQ